MSAEMLRRAAELMRERAEAATPQRWSTYEEHGRDITDEGWSEVGVKALGVTIAYTAAIGFEDNDNPQADADHIASWHPIVALAVADWLDGVAQAIENWGRGFGPSPDQSHAFTVARAYLGELT